MYIFVSWAYLNAAEAAEARRAEWEKGLSKKKEDVELSKAITQENCLPEYHGYLQALAEAGDEASQGYDSLNKNLLGVRFFVPNLEKIATYQQTKRMPGSGKLPVSLASRAFLLNNFKSEWMGEPGYEAHRRITFVGLEGVKEFFQHFGAACAALGEPLPYDLWATDRIVELPADNFIRDLIDALAYNSDSTEQAQLYKNLILGWMGVGASAERDNAVAVAAGIKLGLQEIGTL
jgi:hypothetical protein|tara:strand:+ start:4831 stop:5532 length:702 start_codon:yes stop_codon:yes gene_type:complete